jgi:hypothetical protein
MLFIQTVAAAWQETKKEAFPGAMTTMTPGKAFPRSALLDCIMIDVAK